MFNKVRTTFCWSFFAGIVAFFLWFQLARFVFVGDMRTWLTFCLAIGFCFWTIALPLLSYRYLKPVAIVLAVVTFVGTSLIVSASVFRVIPVLQVVSFSAAGAMLISCSQAVSLERSKLCVNAIGALLLSRLLVVIFTAISLDYLVLISAPMLFLAAIASSQLSVLSTFSAQRTSFQKRSFFPMAAGITLYGIAMGYFREGTMGMYRSESGSPIVPLAAAFCIFMVACISMQRKSDTCLNTFKATKAIFYIGIALFLSFEPMVMGEGKTLVLSAQLPFMLLFFTISPYIKITLFGRDFTLFAGGFTLYFGALAFSSILCRAINSESISYAAVAAAVLVVVMLVDLCVFQERHYMVALSYRDSSLFDRRRIIGFAISEIAQNFSLSAREVEVMELWIDGDSASSVAAKLYISESTVRTHIKSLYTKCNIHSKAELRDLVFSRVVES